MQAAHDRLRHLFRSLLARFASAIEFWTAACLARDLGNPGEMIDGQWSQFRQDLQDLREALMDVPDVPPVVHEQVARMIGIAVELRDLFDVLLDYRQRPENEIEAAVVKLDALWSDLRSRISLASAVIPLPSPLPSITSEQEAHYRSILDGLFDRFMA